MYEMRRHAKVCNVTVETSMSYFKVCSLAIKTRVREYGHKYHDYSPNQDLLYPQFLCQQCDPHSDGISMHLCPTASYPVNQRV